MQRNQIIGLSLGAALLVAIGGGTYWYMNQDSDETPAAPSDTAGSGTTASSGTAASSGASKTLPAPVILVIDRNVIMQSSSVGQDVARQVQAFAEQAKAELRGPSAALASDGAALQRQINSMAPDVRQKRVADFESRQAALRAQVQRKDDQIKNAVGQARAAMEKTLGPILKALVAERGANLLLDKQAVTFATDPSMDITADAVTKLNGQLSSFKIDLNAPPPAGQQAQPAQ